MNCRLDGQPLIEIMDLGNPYVSNFVDNIGDGERFPLKLGLGQESGLLQLYDSYSPEKMYSDYWYLSGVNESMRIALSDVFKGSWRWVTLEHKDVGLDIGSNDGTLLSMYPNFVTTIGCDPAKNLAPLALKKGVNCVIPDFFSSDAFKGVCNKKAKLITCIAMFYDLDNPIEFCRQVHECLADDGIFIIQQSYMPLMLEQKAFDNICHEHLMYHTFRTMEDILWAADLCVVDVELNSVNGGSFRIYAAKDPLKLKVPRFERDLGLFRTASLDNYETQLYLDDPNIGYIDFLQGIEFQRAKTLQFLVRAKEQGKLVLGLGASTKGNTLLQYYGIVPELIPAIGERSPNKIGKLTSGSWIPIVSEEEIREQTPDYVFVLPWHFIGSILDRETELRNRGCKFVVPLPDLKFY